MYTPSPPSTLPPLLLEPLEPRTLMTATATVAPLHAAGTAPVVQVSRGRSAIVSAQDRQQLLDHLTPALQADLQPLLDRGDGAAFDAALLRYMSRRAGPRYLFNPKRLASYLGYMKSELPDLVQTRVARADDILAHRFPEQINSDTYTVQLSRAIDWDLQPATTDNPDFLHSLNRHTYWEDLALAYRLTGDVRYANELTDQLVSWSRQNPNLANPDDWADVSPHWWLLDAADRAQTWTSAYFLLLGTAGWSAQANTLFLARLYDHADFLSRVTPGPLKANRTTLQATGLLQIASLFPEFSSAAAWKAQATKLMFECLDAQYYPDGGHIEETPAYQASTLSAMSQEYRLAQLNITPGQSPWPRKARRKLTRAIEAFYQLLSPDGTLPALSDTYRSANPLPFLTSASFVFDEPRYRLTTPRLDDVLLIGPDALSKVQIPVRNDLPDRGTSYALPDAGYYLLRSRELGSGAEAASATQVVFDAGPKGGTHGHYDLLSFELSDATLHTLVADPGPYRYDDSAQRQWVVSTPAHNTISIDGLNHAAVEGAHNPAVVVDRFETTDDHALITAHHYAYNYLKGAPVVGRTIWLDRSNDNHTPLMLVVDYGQARATHTFTTSLNLPGEGAQALGGGIVEQALTRFYTLRVQSIPVSGQTDVLEPAFTSNRPPPDATDPASRYAVSQKGRRAIFVTLVTEYVSAGEFAEAPPTAEFAEPPSFKGPLKIRLTYSDGSTRVVTLDPPALGRGEIHTDPPPRAPQLPMPGRHKRHPFAF